MEKPLRTNVKDACIILISFAIEAAMMEDCMMSQENALLFNNVQFCYIECYLISLIQNTLYIFLMIMVVFISKQLLS